MNTNPDRGNTICYESLKLKIMGYKFLNISKVHLQYLTICKNVEIYHVLSISCILCINQTC